MRYRWFGTALLAAGLLFSTASFGKAQTHIMTISSSKEGWLGVEIQDVTKRLQDKQHLTVSDGAYVTEVVEESPAEDAGIKVGDVIVNVDGKSIEDGDDLSRVVRRIKPSTEVKVELVRGGDKKTLTAKIGRSRTPEAFSYGFGNGMRAPVMPRMPRMPRMNGHFFFSDEQYGLDLQSLSRQLSDYFGVPDHEGMLVASVEKGSSADKAGFQAGDVLTKIDGESIRDLDDLHDALRGTKSEDKKCDVIRKGKDVSLTWRIERSDDRDEDNDEDEDEGEEGSSYNFSVPHWHYGSVPFHWEMTVPSSAEMRHFKEQMRDFKKELKEKLQDLRRQLRAEYLQAD